MYYIHFMIITICLSSYLVNCFLLNYLFISLLIYNRLIVILFFFFFFLMHSNSNTMILTFLSKINSLYLSMSILHLCCYYYLYFIYLVWHYYYSFYFSNIFNWKCTILFWLLDDLSDLLTICSLVNTYFNFSVLSLIL